MTHINPFSPACDFDSIEFRKAPLGILGGRMFYESTAAAEEDSITTTTTTALQSSSSTQGKYQRCGGVVYPEVCLIDASLHLRANLPGDNVDNSNNLGDEGGEGSMAMFTTPFSEKKVLNSAVVDPSPSFTNAHTKSKFGGTNHEENSISLDRQCIFDVRNNNSGCNNVSTAPSTSALSRSLRHQDKSSMRHFASNCLSPTAWRDSLSRTEVALKIREALSASNLAAIPMVCPTLHIISSIIPHLQPWTLPITASKGSLFRLDDTVAAASVSSPHRAFDLSATNTNTNNSSVCHTIRSMARVRGDVADVPTVQVIAFHPYLPVLAVCLQRSPRSSAIIRLFSVIEGAYIEGVELAHAFQRGVTTLQWKQPYSKGVLAVGASGGVLLWSIKCLEDFGKGKGSSSGRNNRSVGGSSSSLNFSGTGQYNAGGIHAEQESVTRSGAWRRSNVSSSQRVAETGATSPSDYSFNNRSGANQGTNSWTQQGNPHLSTSASPPQFDNSLSSWGSGDEGQRSSFIGRPSMKSRKSDGGGGQREVEPSSPSATCVCYPCSGGDQGVLISSIVFAKLPVQGNDGEYRACDTMLCGARQSPFVHIFDLHAIPEDSLIAKVAGFEGGGVSCLGISQMAASGASVGILASSSRGSTSQRRQGWKGPNRQHEEDSTNENEAEFDIRAVGAASKIVNRLFCVRGFESSKKIQVLNLGANNATTIFEMPQPVVRLERCDVTAEDAFAVQFDSCEVICIAVISPKQVSILANIVTGIHRGVGGRALDIRVCHSTLYVRVSSGHVLNISLLGSLRNNTREGKQLSAMITGGIALGAFSAASQWHLATPEDRGYLLSHLVGNNCVIAMDAFQNFQNGSLVAVVDSVSGVLKVVPTYYNRR